MQVQAFDRHNVLNALNRAGRALLGVDAVLRDFAPLVGLMGHFTPLAENLACAQGAFARPDPGKSEDAEA